MTDHDRMMCIYVNILLLILRLQIDKLEEGVAISTLSSDDTSTTVPRRTLGRTSTGILKGEGYVFGQDEEVTRRKKGDLKSPI